MEESKDCKLCQELKKKEQAKLLFEFFFCVKVTEH